MFHRKAQAFYGDQFLDSLGVDAGVVQGYASAHGVADQADGEIVDYVQQGGQVENVFGYGVGCAWSPAAVAMAAEIQGVDVIALT
jgi:hypothetical protein